MIVEGIINPQVCSLLCRVRHTNRLVISDYAFPYWPKLETVDVSFAKGIPEIPDILSLILKNFKVRQAWMAEEFLSQNEQATVDRFSQAFSGVNVAYEPHLEFKKKVPDAIGLIRTGDATMYGNLILESA